MPDVTISYKGSQIASMDASGTKTLLTEGKYCEDDIFVSYNKTGNATAEGDSSVSVNDAESGNICSLIQYGVCEQDAQTNAISCNNGTLSVQSGEIVTTAANREAIALGSQTATVENLYAVGNVRDEQELVTGTVTRKNAACIYDGTQPVGDRYISSTGAKDNGAIIIYPLETEHTGGSIVSFTETVKQDVNSLEASIEPIQDLHGYANPWPAGGGKNIIPTDLATLRARNTGGTWTDNKYVHNGLTFTINPDGTITINGTATADTYLSYIDASIAIPLTAGSYILHGIGSSDINVFAGKDGAWWGQATTSNKTLTSSSDFTFSVASYIPSGKSFTGFVLKPMFEKGSTASAWEPNSNICPISGLTGLSVYRTGKNLFNPDEATDGKYIGTSGTIGDDVSSEISEYIPVTVGEKYTWSFVTNYSQGSSYANGNRRMHGYKSDGTWKQQLTYYNVTGNEAQQYTLTVTIPSGVAFVRLSEKITDENIQFEHSDNATAYEPYSGNIYAVDWSTQAGTVYGGTVDVVTGVLNVTHSIIDLGNVNWKKDNNRAGVFYGNVTGRETSSYVLACSDYLVLNQSVSTAVDMYISGYFSYGSTTIFVRDTRFSASTAAEYKAGAAGIKVVYELATPITYQLTPQEVVTLVGANNIFSPDATSIKVAVSNPVIEYIASQPLTLAEGSNTVSATNLSVSSVPLELNYISKVVQPTPTFQSKTVSPSTSQQTVSPDSGYDGLSQVTVNAMPSGSATTPATTITANPTISVNASGVITASVSKTQGVTPTVSAGYVASGTAGTVTVNGSKTQQLTVYNGEHHSVIAIISFTIGTRSYQAQDGMTWGEWVESEYNTGGFYTISNYVYINEQYYVAGAKSTEVIIADYTYRVSGGGTAD